MKTNQLKKLLESKDFNIHIYEQEGSKCAEIETWTQGGVNMILNVMPFTIEAFEERVKDFNIDEEIELHRQSQEYKNAFTIRESLNDFEAYHKRLKDTMKSIKSHLK